MTPESLTPESLSDLLRRYAAGELSLDAAGPAVFALISGKQGGFSVAFDRVPVAQHERVWALMGYLKWRMLTKAGVPLPRPASDAEFAALGRPAADEE
jgi:hypothetical protein